MSFLIQATQNLKKKNPREIKGWIIANKEVFENSIGFKKNPEMYICDVYFSVKEARKSYKICNRLNTLKIRPCLIKIID